MLLFKTPTFWGKLVKCAEDPTEFVDAHPCLIDTPANFALRQKGNKFTGRSGSPWSLSKSLIPMNISQKGRETTGLRQFIYCNFWLRPTFS